MLPYLFFLTSFTEDFEQEKEHKQEREENIERQASVEKQHVYNDAFIQQMRYYEQFGETESTYVILIHHCCQIVLHVDLHLFDVSL